MVPATTATVRHLAPLMAIYVAAEQEAGAGGRRFSLVR